MRNTVTGTKNASKTNHGGALLTNLFTLSQTMSVIVDISANILFDGLGIHRRRLHFFFGNGCAVKSGPRYPQHYNHYNQHQVKDEHYKLQPIQQQKVCARTQFVGYKRCGTRSRGHIGAHILRIGTVALDTAVL